MSGLGGLGVSVVSLLAVVGAIWRALLRIPGLSEPVPPDPRPPAFTVRPAPPYDWNRDGG